MMATFALVSVLGHVPNALLRPGKAPCRISVPGKAPCRISVPVALFEHHVVEHVVAQHHLVTRALPPLPTNGFEALLQYMATLAQHCRHGALPTVPTSTAAHLSLAYLSSLEHHYFRTTTAQAFSLVAAGDALAQAIEMRTGGVAYDPAPRCAWDSWDCSLEALALRDGCKCSSERCQGMARRSRSSQRRCSTLASGRHWPTQPI